jgi:predicted CXXCH cytochrome family protein
MSCRSLLPALLVPLLLLPGCAAKDGSSCSVTQEADGSATIRCDDGTTATVPAGTNGTNGTNGASCTVTDEGNGQRRIACTDGTSVVVSNGSNGTNGTNGVSCTVAATDGGAKVITCTDGTTATVTDGASCTVTDDGAGTKTIRCEDGTTVTVRDGQDTASARVGERHGEAVVAASGAFAQGRAFVDATITQAVVSDAGVLTVDFTVARQTGEPVLDVPSVSANVVKLAALPDAPQGFTRWVPYVARVETVTGPGFPRPAGTTAVQAYREANGTFTNHGDGSYTYVFATNLLTAQVQGAPVGFEPSVRHRVGLFLGGATGPTATATKEFVPDGSDDPRTRDIVRTTACQECHGDGFEAHGGHALSVEACATCHLPGSTDAQGGQSLDLRVLLHKVHLGGDLPSVAGPDGNPWLTADNGEYAIWGSRDEKFEWSRVGFPAKANNCVKCHDGSGADSDAWLSRPTRAACGSCHDTVDFSTTSGGHTGGLQLNDTSCRVCHAPSGGLSPLELAHDAFTTNPSAPLFDARNQPEFTFDVTLTPPANGTDYRGTEAPVARIVIRRGGVPLPDHRIAAGTAQGCQHSGSPVLCDPDFDGRFAVTSLFVSGPRARAKPVLTTAARAQIVSASTGPFDLSAPGAGLTLRVDQGQALVLPDAWGTRVPGTFTVPVSSGTFPSGTTAVTPAELVAWLNGNATFARRAIAWLEGGRLAIRTRGLGRVNGLQLQASVVATAVFGGDLTVKMPSGSTTSNQLTSTTDPKVTRFTDRIEYALDPVTDLEPGTYVLNLEVAQLGRVSATNYVTPSVKKVTFQVKTPTEEKPVANGCESCHQASAGPDFAGFVLDPSRHNKIFDATAVDQCIACHDYLPQAATDSTGAGNWTGARPLSRRVHAIHNGSSLQYPLRTVDYANGDPVLGRNWNITYPQPVLNCETCHGPTTSGTWRTKPGRLACSGCHDGDAAMTHMSLGTLDPTPLDPWSGDEEESCATCH